MKKYSYISEFKINFKVPDHNNSGEIKTKSIKRKEQIGVFTEQELEENKIIKEKVKDRMEELRKLEDQSLQMQMSYQAFDIEVEESNNILQEVE